MKMLVPPVFAVKDPGTVHLSQSPPSSSLIQSVASQASNNSMWQKHPCPKFWMLYGELPGSVCLLQESLFNGRIVITGHVYTCSGLCSTIATQVFLDTTVQ